MRKIDYLALVALVAIAFTGCKENTNEPEFRLTDLQGLWLEDNTEHYVRFTDEKSDETDYLYGREWHEDEDYTEADLKPYGMGWFKYKFEKNGNLTEIHLMDNGGAEIPKIYVVTKLTDADLEYYEKDYKSNKYSFSRILPLDTYPE